MADSGAEGKLSAPLTLCQKPGTTDIYGSFDNKAIESVSGKSSIKDKNERVTLSNIKDLLERAGKPWVEE
jgi:acyl-CoA-binding protein